MDIRLVSHQDRDLHNLIRELDQELLERYPAEDIFGVDFNSPYVTDITFAVGYKDHAPAACGALRPLDNEYVELKRFFVKRIMRKQGLASALLAFLEDRARLSGYRFIRLETGPMQPESIALYTKRGYRPIEKYGEYVDCDSSLCFEKKL